jgi:hypothetical protein
MRLSILAFFLCASVVARGQSDLANFGSARLAGPASLPPAALSSTNGPLPSTRGALGELAQIQPRDPRRIDPKMAIHPPQSAIGTLPPPIHVLPKIYPNLTMLLIQADSAATTGSAALRAR